MRLTRNVVVTWMALIVAPSACGDPSLSHDRADDSNTGGGFWDSLRTSASWVEHQPTLRQLSESADAVVLGRFVAVEQVEVRGDSEDAAYSEFVFRVQVVREVSGSPDGSSLLLTGIPTSFGIFESELPPEPALLILRRRMSGSFRVINGYGIWAATSRGALDAPLNEEPPSEGIYAQEIAPHGSVSELADALR